MTKGGARDGTAGVVWLSAAIATVMIAQQIASKAVRDGFFLSLYDVTALPFATLAAAAASFAAALLLGKFIATFSPAAAVPVLFATNGLLFLAESALVGSAPRLVAAGLFLHIAAFGAAVVSGFWSVINERFDPYTAKKVMGRIAGGATLGGVLGGALTWALSDVEPRLLLAGFGVSSLVCAGGVALAARGGRAEKAGRKAAPLLAGVGVLAENAYPRSIAVMVFLAALMQGSVDYVFKAGVAASTPRASLVGFFAVFYTVTGVATFVAQAVGSRRVLKGLGVVPTVALFPIATLLLLVVALVFPGLATLVLLQGGGMVVENSLYRSGYELLYTAVPREQKRSAKVLIDLGSDRLGTAAASGLALGVIALGTLAVDRTLLLTGLAVALAIVGVLVGVRREYIASLANQLRRALAPDEVVDPTMQLATTFVADMDLWEAVPGDDASSETGTSSRQRIGREALLELVRTRADEKRATPPRRRATSALLSQPSERLLDTPLRERLRDASSDDDDLRRTAPAAIGQLGDILLSQRESVATRLRALELLAEVPSQRGAATLVEVLSEPELRLRRAGAIALLQVTRAAPALRPKRRVLAELAVKELRRPARPLGKRSAFERSSPFIHDSRGNELAPTLELVLLLLSIGGDAEELRLALRAITSEDAHQRGTGLEYLDNLLPGNLRSRLLALVEHPELTQADRRVAPDVTSRLASALRAGEIDLRELRAEFRRARKAKYDAGS